MASLNPIKNWHTLTLDEHGRKLPWGRGDTIMAWFLFPWILITLVGAFLVALGYWRIETYLIIVFGYGLIGMLLIILYCELFLRPKLKRSKQ